jgi:hypothetical protein
MNRLQGEEKLSPRPSFYAENRRITLAMTILRQRDGLEQPRAFEHTVQRNNTEDEDNRESHDHDRVDLEPRRLISV